MARNEEKQLARLNRFYLQQQKDEELKKRPPRPRLDTLNTPREIRKWLPTITRDIDFYCKQMEVPCYPQSKLNEFSERIQKLKGEYRAYLHKLRALEPDQDVLSWSSRPYSARKRQAKDTQEKLQNDAESSEPPAKTKIQSSAANSFVPLSTPVLQHLAQSLPNQYGFEPETPQVWKVNPETQDQPLEFGLPSRLALTDSAENSDDKNSCGLSSEGGSTKKHLTLLCSRRPPRSCAEGGVSIRGLSASHFSTCGDPKHSSARISRSGPLEIENSSCERGENEEISSSLLLEPVSNCAGETVCENIHNLPSEERSGACTCGSNKEAEGHSSSVPDDNCRAESSSSEKDVKHECAVCSAGRNLNSEHTVTSAPFEKLNTVSVSEVPVKANPLNLDYSDSSDSDER